MFSPPPLLFSLSIRSFFSLFFFFFSFFSFLIGSPPPVCVKRVRSSVRVESTPPPLLLLSSLPSSFFFLHHRRRVQRDWPASPIDAVNLLFLLYYTTFFWPSLVFKIFELVVPRSRQTMSFSKMLLHHVCCTWLLLIFFFSSTRPKDEN